MFQRTKNWHGALDALVLAKQETAFSYGSMDCCLFACDAIQTMTGVDPAAWFRGKYTTRAGALELMQEYAGSTSVQAVTEKITAEHGMESIPVPMAGRGDLLLIKRPKDFSLGIVALDGLSALVPAENGIVRTTLSDAVAAWRV
jgi:hypothetical protein